MSLYSSRLAIAAILVFCGSELSALAQAPESGSEDELLAILQSDAPGGDKAIACKKLAVVGSEAAVPELAKLLSDERLASWARIPLEAIPGSAADEALRSAAGSLEGQLLVGVVNSIGVRQDAEAVDLLAGLLANDDAQVASSAAVALGKIGNENATSTLQGALADASEDVRSGVAEGLVLCAERALAAGDADDAIAIYDQVRAAEVPKQRAIEATRGAILARGEEGIPLLVEQLRSGDKHFFYIALKTAREVSGTKIDRALAAELQTIAPFRAPALIATMADRPETVELSALESAAGSGPEPVRVAAIAALGRVGNVSCLDLLLGIAAQAESELSQPAKDALAVLPGETVDGEIVGRLDGAERGAYLALIELIGVRRIEAVDSLLAALDNSDAQVRAAALASLGRTIPFERLSVLIEQATSPRHAEDAQAAQQALEVAAVRMPDREECAAQIAKAADDVPIATHVALLEVLASVGGKNSLEAVHAAAKTNHSELRDASTRLLGGWMTVDAAPVLLDLSQSGPADRFRVRALRGYLRIARQFVRDEAERVAMCRTALEVAEQPAEQKLILEVLERSASLEALKLAVELRQHPTLKEDALRTVLSVAQSISGHSDEVLALLEQAELPTMKIEIVSATYGSGGSQQSVTDVLQQQVTDRPVILLPAGSYNESFGGDPAPGQRKQLRIQYKIDGKSADARLPEDRLIVLTLPKE